MHIAYSIMLFCFFIQITQAQTTWIQQDGELDQLFFVQEQDTVLVWSDMGQLKEVKFNDVFYKEAYIGFILETATQYEFYLLKNKSGKWKTCFVKQLSDKSENSKNRLSNEYFLTDDLILEERISHYSPKEKIETKKYQYNKRGKRKLINDWMWELDKIVFDSERKHMTELVEEDEAILNQLKKLNAKRKKNVDKIITQYNSGVFSNIMKVEIARLLFVDSDYALEKYFEIFPDEHWHSHSLRPYEMMNFPAISAFYASREKWPLIQKYLNGPSLLTQCNALESFNGLIRVHLLQIIRDLKVNQKRKDPCFLKNMNMLLLNIEN